MNICRCLTRSWLAITLCIWTALQAGCIWDAHKLRPTLHRDMLVHAQDYTFVPLMSWEFATDVQIMDDLRISIINFESEDMMMTLSITSQPVPTNIESTMDGFVNGLAESGFQNPTVEETSEVTVTALGRQRTGIRKVYGATHPQDGSELQFMVECYKFDHTENSLIVMLMAPGNPKDDHPDYTAVRSLLATLQKEQ